MTTKGLRTADGTWIARDVRMVCSFTARCVGLLGNAGLNAQEGILLSPGGSIHTMGMRFAIDVVFLSRQMRVLELAPYVPPWRVRRAPAGTGRVLELAAGRIAATGLTPGTFVIVESGSDEEEAPQRRASAGMSRHTRPGSACDRLPIRFSLRLPLRHVPGPCDATKCGLERTVPAREDRS